jgi:SAM-dependent methyltransferase
MELSQSLLQDIIGWDVRSWGRCLAFWSPVLQEIRPASARVLTLGERDGGISLWFALQGYQVICSDFNGPTPRARKLHEQYGVGHLVTYEDVDVFEIPHEAGSFDIVACKSVIGGLKLIRHDPSTRSLENQSRAVAEIHRVTKPGGAFLGAENLTGSAVHRMVRAWAKDGRIGWRHLTQSEILQLFDQFASVEQRAFGFLGSRISTGGVDRLTSLIDTCLCPILPARWQYISFIRARKAIEMRFQ